MTTHIETPEQAEQSSQQQIEGFARLASQVERHIWRLEIAFNALKDRPEPVQQAMSELCESSTAIADWAFEQAAVSNEDFDPVA